MRPAMFREVPAWPLVAANDPGHSSAREIVQLGVPKQQRTARRFFVRR